MKAFIFNLVLLFGAALAQERGVLEGAVHGVDTGQPIAGCNIVVEGTGLGTASDSSGAFHLAGLPYGEVTLLITHVGYQSLQQAVRVDSPLSKINFALRPRLIATPPTTVTATRARERETPVAFATIKRDDIEQRYVSQDLPVALSELPSSTHYSENGNGLGYTYLTIRGFDQRRLSVLINGIPQNDPEDHNVYWLDFPDFAANLEDIQVQRGAGSAFYGPPAIGGSVNIITRSLSPERQVAASLGGGSFATRRYAAIVNSGVFGGRYIFYARASKLESEGYRDRSWIDFWSYFFSLARDGKDSNLKLNVYGGPIKDGLAYTGLPKFAVKDKRLRRKNFSYWETSGDTLTVAVERRPDEIENFNQPHVELFYDLRIGERLQISNAIFFIRGSGFFDYDGSWAPFSYFRLTRQFGFDVTDRPDTLFTDDLLIRAYVDNHQVGWLPQAVWSHGYGRLTFGAELRRHRSLHWGHIQKGSGLPNAIGGEYDALNYIGHRRYYEYRGAKDIVSLYAHENWQPRPNVNLMLDLQFVHQRYRLYDEQFIGTDFEVPYNFLNPRLGINYNVNEKLNAFASVSRTSREPRLKNLYDAAEASTPASWGVIVPQFEALPDGRLNFDKPLVKPESLVDVELGMGYRTSRWQAALNLFYMDFRDEIIKSGQLDRFGQPITGNAEGTLHQGVELSLEMRVTGGLVLSGNMMVSRNELRRYSIFTSEGGEMRLDGNSIAGFPDFIANARLTYSRAGFSASLAMQSVGKQYTDNLKDERNAVDPFTVFNGALGYHFGAGSPLAGLNLQFQAQNLLDKLYALHGEGHDFFPAAERQVFLSVKYDL
jgi:iron complex outermembrane receptor protein